MCILLYTLKIPEYRNYRKVSVYLHYIITNMDNVDVEVLIQLVKTFPCLYDKRNKGYKDIVRKENCWKEISETVHTSPKECEDIFKKLKEKFIRERKTVKPRSGDGAPEINSGWVWYNDMLFLNDHIKERRRVFTNLIIKSPSTIVEIEDGDLLGSQDSRFELPNSDNEVNDISTLNTSTWVSRVNPHASTSGGSEERGSQESQEAIIEVPVSSASTSSFKKRRTTETPKKGQASAEVDDKILETLQGLNSKRYNDDSSFGNLIVDELNKIENPVKKRILKKQILDLIFSDE